MIEGSDMTSKGREYFDRLIRAWNHGHEEAVLDICDELNEDQDTYLEVWGKLPSTMRRQIKELIDRDLHG